MSWKCADKKTELSSACWPDSKILNGLPKKHWFPTTFTCNLAQLKYLTFAWLRKWNGLEEILTDDGWMNAQADQYPQDQLTLLEKSSSIQICACMKAVFLLHFNWVYYCGLLFFLKQSPLTLIYMLFFCSPPQDTETSLKIRENPAPEPDPSDTKFTVSKLLLVSSELTAGRPEPQ